MSEFIEDLKYIEEIDFKKTPFLYYRYKGKKVILCFHEKMGGIYLPDSFLKGYYYELPISSDQIKEAIQKGDNKKIREIIQDVYNEIYFEFEKLVELKDE